MILYLSGLRGTQIMDGFLRYWGPHMRSRILTVPYSQLPRLLPLPRATLIFSDLEILSPEELAYLGTVRDQFGAQHPDSMMLNDPIGTLRRYDLLGKLYREGINAFRVRRLGSGEPNNFPVFLRRETDHGGSLTPLLEDQHALDLAVADLESRAVSLDGVLIVEYCNTVGDDGLYRKYSAFRIGPTIIPWHLIFGRHWLLKSPGPVTRRQIDEEWRYLETNPHERELVRIFELAQVQYGRIDYSLKDGQLQVWEINTNPWIVREPWQYHPARVPTRERSARLALQALERIDDAAVSQDAASWRAKRTRACLPAQLPLVIQDRLTLISKRVLRQSGRTVGRWRRRLASLR